MTAAGAEKLREELQHLKTVERPLIIKAISEARAHGDLSENAEYHAAKEKQGFTEGRIRKIEERLSHAQIINPKDLPNTGKVVFGVTVTLINEEDATVVYQIVGEDEADLKTGKISVSSPIARALIGKEAGDTVSVEAPGGLIVYELDSVSYD